MSRLYVCVCEKEREKSKVGVEICLAGGGKEGLLVPLLNLE